MNKDTLKRVLPMLVFVLLLMPIATSSLLDLEQRKVNELLLEQERVQREAEQKIYLMGKFDPAQREDFVLVPQEYTIVPNKIYLRKETLEAFLWMSATAEKDGIELKIASATRNFDYQKDIWEKKWTGFTFVDGQDLSKSLLDGLERFQKILEYSSVPGTSRHHWGTDVDINNANLEYFETAEGEKVYDWLTKNAPRFGFCQTYNLKGSIRSTGYNEEKWHWSYLPLARDFTQEYRKIITEEDIKGFLGDENIPALDLMNNYVSAINPACI